MVWVLLGVLSSISFANHDSLISELFVVPQPEAQIILTCYQLPMAMDQRALEKERPTLKVFYFESGYERAWVGQNGMNDPKELELFNIISFEGNTTPDFWSARAMIDYPNKEEAYYEFVSYVKDIQKNGSKIHMLKMLLHDSANKGTLVMRMACQSLQTWI